MRWLRKTIEGEFSARSAAWFMLVIAALTYGLFFWQRGFYWDEFPWAWTYFRLGPEVLTKTFTTSRPFWGMIYQLTLPVIGPNPWAWQLLAMVLRWLSAVLFWITLRTVWPSHSKPVFWASLFFLVYPGMGQHFIAMMYSHFYIVLACFLLSLYLSLLALRNEKYRVVLFIGSYLLSAVNLLTMEYFYFLEFVRFFLFLRVLDEEARRRIWRSLYYYFPYLLIFAGVTIWRMFFFTYQNASYEYVLLEAFQQDFLSGIFLLVKNLGISFWRTVFEAWLRPMVSIGSTGLGPRTLTVMLIQLFLVILLVGIFLFKLEDSRDDERIFARQAGWIGLIFWGLSGGSVWMIGVVPQFNFSMDRFMLPFMPGASLIVASLLALMKNRRRQMIVIALLTGFAASRHFQLEEQFRQDWATQKNLFWQMTWRIPDLEKGSILLSNDLPVTYYTDNSLTGPLNWIYSPPGEMDVMLYFASIRVGKTLPSVEPGQPHEHYYIGPTFFGNTSNILVIDYEPPGCFRVVDAEVEQDNRLLPPALKDVARYSNQDVIRFEKQNQLPVQLFGGEPDHNWCYYFGHAELARQKEDWQEVVRLGEQAFALEDHPNDPLERFVFIEGYAHVGDWEKAVELSATSYKISKDYVGPPLCRLWTRMDRETLESSDKTAAVDEVSSRINCLP